MNKPVAKFRAGGVVCALWENEMVLPTGGSNPYFPVELFDLMQPILRLPCILVSE